MKILTQKHPTLANEQLRSEYKKQNSNLEAFKEHFVFYCDTTDTDTIERIEPRQL